MFPAFILMDFSTFLSRSLQGRRLPSIVSVTVWKMCSTHPHIPWRSHYPRGLQGNTPKVWPFPHSILVELSLIFLGIGGWNSAGLVWTKEKTEGFVGSGSVSRRNGQQKRSILIFPIGKSARWCFEIPSFEIAALLSRNILQEWLSWTFHLSAGYFLDKACGVECFSKGRGI